MDQGLVPRRYAKALYEVAVAKDQQKLLYEQMQALEQAFANTHGLADTMGNPFVSDADKAKLIDTAASADGNGLLADFVKLLAQNGRLAMVREIASAYIRLYRQANQIYRVVVTAAAPMAPDEQKRLQKLIQSHLGTGTMEYDFKVDPDLIGGFVVDIDNERLDASVKNELKQLRLKLLQKSIK